MQAHTVTLNTPTDTRIEVERHFHAPLSKLWRAVTEPALVKQWLLGPPGWTMPVCKSDFQIGGSYEYRWRSHDNAQEFGFIGEFQQIETHARIVHTETTPPAAPSASPPPESLVTITFTEKETATTLRTAIDYPSKQARDAALQAGMAAGMQMSYLKLDHLLASPELK